MSRFSATTTAEAVVAADRQAIWDALVDPALVARMTPFVRSIGARDDTWSWQLSGLEVLGVGVAPAFTERMTFTDLERIQFDHQAPPGTTERTGVNGWYELAEVSGGTRLRTSMEVCADLPLPRISSPAVTATMKRVMATMGDRFSRNLLDHLGVRS
jgi:carbon monoxide dehydrogenase subunit G